MAEAERPMSSSHDEPLSDLLDRARARLAAYITEKGLKSTRQRDLIADAFLSQDGHLNVDELLELVRTLDARISSATVYRTMKLLTDCGSRGPR